MSGSGIAKPSCLFDHRFEHHLQIAWRRIDDAEHFGRCRLLRQRLLGLVEQPRVVDGDHGLIGEFLQKRDLLVGEWPYFLTIDAELSDRRPILEQRDDQERADTAEIGGRARHWITRTIALGCYYIDDLNESLPAQQALLRTARAVLSLFEVFGVSGWRSAARLGAHILDVIGP